MENTCEPFGPKNACHRRSAEGVVQAGSACGILSRKRIPVLIQFLARQEARKAAAANRILRRGVQVMGCCVLWLLACSSSWASQSVALAWTPSTNISATGYALYYGSKSGNYSWRIDVGTNTSTVVPGLSEGQTNYFVVTAYNAAKVESAPSGELAYLVPGLLILYWLQPGHTMGLTFPVASGHWYAVQASVDLKTWSTIWQTATATSNAWVQFQDPQTALFQKRFYRLSLN